MNRLLKNAIFYQIYPTSFFDSNNDGVGDLNGITQKVDYVKQLGVNFIYLNPFYPSEFKDGGYDVTDYKNVDPRFGTLEDFKNLVRTYEENGIGVIIDIVFGHTSDKHPWFIESAKAEKNKYSDYYIWTGSIFETYKNKTVLGLYPRNGGYYANYYACQPALNFGFNKVEKPWQMKYDDPRLEPLRNELISILKFWLSLGVKGFRCDMANSLVKDPCFDSLNPEDNVGNKWVWNKIMSAVKSEYPDCIFVAEWVNANNAINMGGFDIDFYAHDVLPYNSLFRSEKNTNLIPELENGINYFSLKDGGNFDYFLERYLSDLKAVDGKGYFSVISGNHDEIRLIEQKDEELMKCIFAFLLTLKHVPFIYYGDEIGMKHNFNVSKDGGYIRTGARTPMIWDNGKNRGFSTNNEVYLPLGKTKSVSDNELDKNSLLNIVRRLIDLRNNHSCLMADANIEFVNTKDYLEYKRFNNEEEILIIINHKGKKMKINNNKEILCSYNFVNNEFKEKGFVVFKN